MIDVHILQHPSDDRYEKTERLLKQLEFEPVKVHLIPGVYRNIGAGRFSGFKSGDEPLVSYVDDDDTIEPGIFDKILERFEQEPELDALCTQEMVHREGPEPPMPRMHSYKYYDKKHVFRLHHLAAYRRASIEPHLFFIKDVQDGAEHGLWAKLLLNDARVAHLPEMGYHWHIHEKSTPHLRLAVPEKIHALYAELKAFYNKPSHIADQAPLQPIGTNVKYYKMNRG